MIRLKEKGQQSSWTIKFLALILMHFLINDITAVLFLMDNTSLKYQVTHLIIHGSFFVLVLKLTYLPEKEIRLSKSNEQCWFLGFTILNLIPFFQGFELADNGFVPMWSMAPQINFGLPFVYLHWFTTDSQNTHDPIINPLLHIQKLAFNLYFWGIFTIVGLIIKRKWNKRIV